MDVIRLDNKFMGDALIEGFDSLIWTDRYRDPGEFELKTYKVKETLALLPVESLISLRDSAEIMMVETAVVEVDESNNKLLTLSGRSIDFFIENRVIGGLSGHIFRLSHPYNSADFTCAMIWDALVNPTAFSGLVPDLTYDTTNHVPHLSLSDSTTAPGILQNWHFRYPDVIANLVASGLKHANLGIRTLRPNSLNLRIVTVSGTALESTTGLITRTLTPVVTDACIDIYNGTDRTKGRPGEVLFTAAGGELDKPQYLFSVKDRKNVGYVSADTAYLKYYESGHHDTYSGFKKRGLLLDLGTDHGDDDTNTTDYLEQKIETEMATHKNTLFFDGGVTEHSKYQYGVDYFLGDKVTLSGEYGVSESMQVTEYIRTQDSQGERGYPTLIVST